MTLIERIVFTLSVVGLIACATLFFMVDTAGDDNEFMRRNPIQHGPDTVYLVDSSGIHTIITPQGVRLIVIEPENDLP